MLDKPMANMSLQLL